MASRVAHPSSFRDPSGFVFLQDGAPYRQINACYRREYDRLVDSGLYEELVGAGLLIPHTVVDLPAPEGGLVIRPERVAMISYPFEWCFGALKDAALVTLEIQKRAISKGMSLKDASAYNIQFQKGKPVFIDTLSFEAYEEGRPWVAYGQFCRHFLAPLLLMSYVDVRLGLAARNYVDGIPLDLASRMLPGRTRWNPSVMMHVHVHGKAQAGGVDSSKRQARVSRTGLLGILDNLEGTVRKLSWEPKGTEWADYYEDTNYGKDGLAAKEKLVDAFLDGAGPKPASVWDVGANDGRFSAIAASRGIATVAWDLDPAAVEKCYRRAKASEGLDLTALIQDLANPSPGLGWAHRERQSMVDRGPADVVLALAVIHHLAIGNNVPLPEIASFFAAIGSTLIVEFVPKSDSQVRRMLANRQDVFPAYTQEGFEEAFSVPFEVARREVVGGTERCLYLMKRKRGTE
jgi:hypothetical protein